MESRKKSRVCMQCIHHHHRGSQLNVALGSFPSCYRRRWPKGVLPGFPAAHGEVRVPTVDPRSVALLPPDVEGERDVGTRDDLLRLGVDARARGGGGSDGEVEPFTRRAAGQHLEPEITERPGVGAGRGLGRGAGVRGRGEEITKERSDNEGRRW